MIKFFRRIRQKLLSENRLSKYIFYAIGEIILVMIGILLALQVNNWNERRKNSDQFTLAMEQMFNVIDIEIQNIGNANALVNQQIDFINELLTVPDSIPLDLLPYYVFYADTGTDISKGNTKSALDFSSIVSLDLNNWNQLKVAKKVSTYIENDLWAEKALMGELSAYFKKHHIPTPNVVFGFTIFDNFNYADIDFFTAEERNKILELVKTEEVRTILRSIKANRQRITFDIDNTLQDALSVMKAIQEYDSTIRLLYDDVGIIGTSIDGYDDVGAKSTPMLLVDEAKSIWEVKLELKKGTVKFRTRDSWNENWGGDTFPKGKAIYFWENIPVEEAGRYRVILNLSEKTYEFIKL